MLRKVIFLDRDGVVNVERGEYNFKVSDFKFVEGLFKALENLSKQGFEFIVITNQGGISKRIYNHNDVFLVHSHMNEEFKQHHIPLLDVYYCPHHNEIEKCICRKPDSLMLEKAIAKYQIDASNSYFIGDSERDILAAQKVNITGIKVNKNDDINNYLNQIKTP